MHAPDGFLEPTMAVATAAISLAVVALCLHRASRELDDRQVAMAAIVAGFVFAAQMFNFPVASGTTGHLMGGALAAILLGRWMGTLVVTLVVVVQALAFADGGVTALGYNVLNMAIVPAFGGWAVFSLCRRVVPASASGVVGATGLAAAASVVLSSVAFSLQWLVGATTSVSFGEVFVAMVGVHALIGIGEGVISSLVVATVLATRPDLVRGADDLSAEQLADRRPVPARIFVAGALVVVASFAAGVSQFAVDHPDGLERVAEDLGFADSARDHSLEGSIFADYATRGIGHDQLSLAVAGLAGAGITLLLAYGIASIARRSGPSLTV